MKKTSALSRREGAMRFSEFVGAAVVQRRPAQFEDARLPSGLPSGKVRALGALTSLGGEHAGSFAHHGPARRE